MVCGTTRFLMKAVSLNCQLSHAPQLMQKVAAQHGSRTRTHKHSSFCTRRWNSKPKLPLFNCRVLMQFVKLDRNIQVLDHDHLFVDGSSPSSSNQGSPSNSRPASAKVRSSSRPPSPGGTSGSFAACHQLHATAILDKRRQQRQKTHQHRKERAYMNIFSDPIIEKELGKLAEERLKEDCAKEFRDHIKNVGGRFSRLSFKRNVFSPEVVVPVISDFCPTRPSFAPLHSHLNIIGLQPESPQEDDAAPEIIEPPSLFRVTARSADIKNISLHSGSTSAPEKSSYHQLRNVTDERIVSAPSMMHIHSVHPAAPSLSVSDFQQVPSQRLASALSLASCNNGLNPSGLCLAGDGLGIRTVQMSGQGKAPSSAYVTAGTKISWSVVLQLCDTFVSDLKSLSVHEGVFVTSAPFAFQSGEKVTFAGAHVPPSIITGKVYTVSMTTALSFKISEQECAGLNVDNDAGIFQVRAWERHLHQNKMSISDQSAGNVLHNPSQDCNEHHAASIQTKPTCHDAVFDSKVANAAMKHPARCISGKRIASSFVTNVAPLQRSNVHDSARCLSFPR